MFYQLCTRVSLCADLRAGFKDSIIYFARNYYADQVIDQFIGFNVNCTSFFYKLNAGNGTLVSSVVQQLQFKLYDLWLQMYVLNCPLMSSVVCNQALDSFTHGFQFQQDHNLYL